MNTTLVAVLAVLGIIAIVFIWRFGGQVRMKLKGPLKTQLEMDGSESKPLPGVRGEDLTSAAGGIKAHDKTGRGVEVKKAKAHQDIELTNESPEGGTRSPKT